jgi:LytR cell envelope-related transcriptional attenuator
VRRLPYGSSPSINCFMTALVAAFSLQDKIDQYGAYAGIAAVFGLGVLSLLYFAQAREVKRLRDWAGRAPERAAELEARVQADAQRRAAAVQQPRPAAPVTPAAQHGAAAPAAAPATAAAAAGAATVAKPATATPQNGTGSSAAVPPPAPATKPAQQEGGGEKPAEGDGKAAEAKPGEGAPQPASPGPAAPAGTPASPGPATPAGAPASAAPAARAGAPASPGPTAPAGPPAPSGAPAPAGAPAPSGPPAPAGPAGRPGQPSGPAIPAATAAAAARPASPLRAPATSTSLPPRTPAGAAPGTGGGHSRGRIAAIVGAVLAVLAVAAVAVVAILLFTGGKDKTPPKPNTVAQPGVTTPAGGKASPAKPAAKLDRKAYPLAVLNGTTVTGLARGAADKLTARGYNEPNVVTNDTTNQARGVTQIFFEPKARPAALDVARILGVKTANVKPMDANARALADRATVAVFVGADKAQ